MENIKNWFNDAKVQLEKHFINNERVDGARFITEYLEVNWPDELDESIEVEQFEDYVNENLDLFENWLSECHTEIEINDNYSWGKLPVSTKTSEVKEEQILSKGQNALIRKEYKNLVKGDFPELGKIRDILRKIHRTKEAASAALKTARIGDDNTEISASERAQAWGTLAFLNAELESDDAFLNFEKAGNIALSDGDSLAAAQYYEKSANSCLDDDWRIKHKLLRKARVLYSNTGVNDTASNLYIQECNLEVKNAKGWECFKGRFYCLLSNYGESPWRVFGWICVLIVLCAFVYWFADINTPGESIYQCNKLITEQISYTCNGLESKRAHPLTHLYFSIVTFTTLGYGDFSPTEDIARAVASIQAFLGLILSSLFIATFLRKFSR
jgi:tetratricopeptide (TPR) repeat protein